MSGAPQGRDVVVIGASAGGVEALTRLLAALPAHFPAAVFTVLHMNPHWPSQLPRVFGRDTLLPVAFAVHGEPVERGRVYVAPPDNQMMIRGDRLHVVRGPKENGHRPSVDALFRTAAASYGGRVIGVVLTGYQNCGTAGLMSIKARGGVAVVQSPDQAMARDMPQSAVDNVAVDHVVSLDEIAPLLGRLVREPPGPAAPVVPGTVAQLEGDEPGQPAEIVCPVCYGSMTQARLNGYESFRCHVGHVFSLDDLSAEQSESVERALWAASRALEESAALAYRMSAIATGDMRLRHEEQAQAQVANAELIRSIILGGKKL